MIVLAIQDGQIHCFFSQCITITMSATIGSGSYDLYYTHGFTLVAITVLAFFYLSAMKMCFGTYFVRTAVSNYKSNKVIRARYYELFTSRDNLMYHISWAKSRGEIEEAKNLMKQLTNVDKVRNVFSSHRVNFVYLPHSTNRKLTRSKPSMGKFLD